MIASSTLPAEYKLKYKTYLEKFDSLSVREENGKRLIEKDLGLRKEVRIVLDPTLLLAKNEWLEYFPQKKCYKEKYILLYVLTYAFEARPYVYQVADIIRNLGKELNCSRYRFIVLTHNYEFLNLLVKNNISSLNLVLSNNILTELKKETILPYTEHLKFVNDVANGNKAVSFQTPNSMRHVLETICNFSCPSKELKDFIAQNEVLADNEYLLTAIHDLSHGAIRVQKPFTDADIQEGCKKIIEYIKQKYAGQIDNL